MSFAVHGVIFLLAIAASTVVHAQNGQASSAELDQLQGKIENQLETGRWSDASKALVRNIWDEYKIRVSAPAANPTTRRTESYVGIYQLGDSKKQISIEDANGALVISLERRRIPAVLSAEGLIFTTGDVVTAKVPQLGATRHAALEFFIVKRIGEGLTFGAFGGQGIKLTKVDQ